MAPHSSTLAWKIPWMEKPGRLQSMGSLRVRYDFTFTFTFHFHALDKEMATHSSVLAWRIPGTGEPGGLQSMGSQSWTRLKWLSSSSNCSQQLSNMQCSINYGHHAVRYIPVTYLFTAASLYLLTAFHPFHPHPHHRPSPKPLVTLAVLQYLRNTVV